MNLNEKDVADILKRENAYCYITINIIKSIEGTYMTFLYQDIVAFVEV